MMSTDSNFRILVADDDAISRRLLVRTLQSAGYSVVEVNDGRMALETLSSADGPRLALIDWVMPIVDGPGVCREVRKQREKPYVHIILLTSKASPHDIVAGLEAGADDYLVKPVHSEELKARLRRGQRIIQLEDELLHNALHDPLTRLPNRALFLDRLGTCLRQAKTCPGYKFAVLFVDLDGFKIVNDSLGHLAGDQLIVAVSRRLANCLRRIDLISRPFLPVGVTVSGSEETVARLGGDEFTILLEGISSSSDSLRVAERIQQ
jgi:PleD family two-component response regulator